jgi:hypothetical protein
LVGRLAAGLGSLKARGQRVEGLYQPRSRHPLLVELSGGTPARDLLDPIGTKLVRRVDHSPARERSRFVENRGDQPPGHGEHDDVAETRCLGDRADGGAVADLLGERRQPRRVATEREQHLMARGGEQSGGVAADPSGSDDPNLHPQSLDQIVISKH